MLDVLSLVTNVHVSRRNPVSLVHFVTNRCNARCSFCFIDFDDPRTFRGELTVEEIDRITKSLGPHLQNVNLTGGEPFARKDILDIARCYFRNTKVRSIFITSNGSLPERMERFTRTLLEEFPDRKVIFSLSIDALAEEHDRIRKLRNLFENCLRAYHTIRGIGGNAMVNIAITVSHENHDIVTDLYEALIEKYGVRSITAPIVRDEGVYKIPENHKRAILEAYTRVTDMIARDLRSGRIEGYDPKTLQGRLMNKKNAMAHDIIKSIYMEPHFVSTCHAAALFGIVGADGTVHPCEILDKPLGNLRNYDYDFLKLWHDRPTQETKKWIKDSKCHCSYECAWSFNILGNARYQPGLIAAAFGKHW